MQPLQILKDAIKAVPAVKYALGVAGIVAVVAIVGGFRIDYRVAVFGGLIVFLGMAVLVIFARAAGLPGTKMRAPALVLTWFALAMLILTTCTLFTCVFFAWPQDLAYWINRASAAANGNGFGPGDKVETETIQLQHFRESHKVAQIIRGISAPTDSAEDGFPYTYKADLNSVDRTAQVSITLKNTSTLVLRGPREGIDLIKETITKLDVPEPEPRVQTILNMSPSEQFKALAGMSNQDRVGFFDQISDYDLPGIVRALYEHDPSQFETVVLRSFTEDELATLLWRQIGQMRGLRERTDIDSLKSDPKAFEAEFNGYLNLVENAILRRLVESNR